MRATGEAIETVAAAGGVQLGGEMDDWPHDRRGDAPPKQSGRGTPMMPTSFSREVFVCTVVGLVILICGLFLFAQKTSLAIDVSLGPVRLGGASGSIALVILGAAMVGQMRHRSRARSS